MFNKEQKSDCFADTSLSPERVLFIYYTNKWTYDQSQCSLRMSHTCDVQIYLCEPEYRIYQLRFSVGLFRLER